ncbi:MAG: PIG-L family deacetylase [Spirochaetia bacterium]|jgi:LmbE family N-acetylglucosaminyl deacetylase|nr:PIG-L family deacetylase [Spirochaetia bacterium]
MKNKEKTVNTVSNKYLSFVLMYQRKQVALLNIDHKECTLYDKIGDGFLNPYLKGFSDKKLKLRLMKDAGSWQLESNREVFVNGVAWRKRILKDNDKIFLGEYRLIFKGHFVEDISPSPVHEKNFKWKKGLRFLEVAAVVLSASFLWYCTSLNHNTVEVTVRDESQVIGHESELPYNFSEELDNVEDAPYVQKERDLKYAVDSLLSTYAPGEALVPQKLDILFIHAHPDDESLDYGLYMAEASLAGKSIGNIIFTDGDSGFDKYPDRPIDGFYKDMYLKGADLAEVRVQEAQNALTVLGSKVYIRLGLWNRAYTSEEASKSVGTLITEWGGQDELINKLVNIMEIFRPEVIVSPDGPCDASEHFEHEAVGLVSELAVSVYMERNPGSLEAYLKLVDVEQLGAYPDVPLLEIDAVEDRKYRDLKYAALMMHQTQADASYFGIKRLEKYPVEYYIVNYRSKSPLDSALAFLDKKMVETLSEPTY